LTTNQQQKQPVHQPTKTDLQQTQSLLQQQQLQISQLQQLHLEQQEAQKQMHLQQTQTQTQQQPPQTTQQLTQDSQVTQQSESPPTTPLKPQERNPILATETLNEESKLADAAGTSNPLKPPPVVKPTTPQSATGKRKAKEKRSDEPPIESDTLHGVAESTHRSPRKSPHKSTKTKIQQSRQRTLNETFSKINSNKADEDGTSHSQNHTNQQSPMDDEALSSEDGEDVEIDSVQGQSDEDALNSADQ
jgi:hypothetical protein